MYIISSLLRKADWTARREHSSAQHSTAGCACDSARMLSEAADFPNALPAAAGRRIFGE